MTLAPGSCSLVSNEGGKDIGGAQSAGRPPRMPARVSWYDPTNGPFVRVTVDRSQNIGILDSARGFPRLRLSASPAPFALVPRMQTATPLGPHVHTGLPPPRRRGATRCVIWPMPSSAAASARRANTIAPSRSRKPSHAWSRRTGSARRRAVASRARRHRRRPRTQQQRHRGGIAGNVSAHRQPYHGSLSQPGSLGPDPGADPNPVADPGSD